MHQRERVASSKELRQEDSEAVWNELSHYRSACEELVQQKLILEEERDSYYAKCLKNQTTIAELQALLDDKNDLERKVAAIVAVEPLQSVTKQEIEKLRNLLQELQEKDKQHVMQKRKYENELEKLREELAHLQLMIMKPKTVSTSTMTEVLEPLSTVGISSSKRDTRRTAFKDSQTSPWKNCVSRSTMTDLPKCVTGSMSQNKQTVSSNKVHGRTRSESEILPEKKSAWSCFEREAVSEGEVQDQKIFARREKFSTKLKLNERLKLKSVKCVRHGNETPTSSKIVRKEIHKCKWRHEMKVLNQQLQSLTKQVQDLATANLSIKQSLQEERSIVDVMKSKSEELRSQLQKCRSTIQSLKTDKEKLTLKGKGLQQQVEHLEAQVSKNNNNSNKEAELKLKDVTVKYSSLKSKAKLLEEDLQTKSNELQCAKENISKHERDVKQKRQLIESLRTKLKQAEKSTFDFQDKYEGLMNEMTERAKSTQQNRLKVEALRSQLSRQTKDKEELMEMLTSCQQELAKTIQELATCQDSSSRRTQADDEAIRTLKQQMKQVHVEFKERLSVVDHQLKGKEEVLKEFHKFIKVFARELEVCSRIRVSSQPGPCQHRFSESVRNIARASLNLTDIELDEFLKDTETLTAPVPFVGNSLVSLAVKTAKSKPPFASQLVKSFMDFFQKFEVCTVPQ